MTSILTEEQPEVVELVRQVGTDQHTYVIRPMIWTIDNINEAWDRYKRFGILSDDVPQNVQGFGMFVVGNGSIWFEIYDETENRQVGLIYLNEFARSPLKKNYIQALFHAVMWDGKISVRKELGRMFLREIFARFGFHRLQAEIPLKFGGAIRALRKMGFKVEGELRQARQYKGEWFNVLVLGILESEV